MPTLFRCRSSPVQDQRRWRNARRCESSLVGQDRRAAARRVASDMALRANAALETSGFVHGAHQRSERAHPGPISSTPRSAQTQTICLPKPAHEKVESGFSQRDLALPRLTHTITARRRLFDRPIGFAALPTRCASPNSCARLWRLTCKDERESPDHPPRPVAQ